MKAEPFFPYFSGELTIYSGKKTCIIVCGHYGCGGVKAAMEKKDHGLIDNWLHHIRDVYRTHRHELDEIEGDADRIDRICELNVVEQVVNVCNTTVVRNAWKRGQELSINNPHPVIHKRGLQESLSPDGDRCRSNC